MAVFSNELKDDTAMITTVAIKNAKPKQRQYRLTDNQGLYLLIKPTGSKCWRYDYRFSKKRK